MIWCWHRDMLPGRIITNSVALLTVSQIEGAGMTELLDNLRSRFSEPLVDGRKMDFRLELARDTSRIVVGTSRYCEARLLAIIIQSDDGYIMDAPGRSPVACLTQQEVMEQIEDFAKPYSSACWNCHQPLSLTSETRCPKCRRFVVCECGKCLCDNPAYPIRPAISPEKVDELNKRFGWLFKKNLAN